MGGALRDIFLGRETTDLDLACAGSAETLAAELARATGGTLVMLDDATKVYRIALKDSHLPITQIDVAQIVGRDIHEDLLRRDFTCNALALPLEKLGATRQTLAWPSLQSAILDPRGGLKDIQRKRIRTDTAQVFKEDPLRLLRAFRFAAQLQFKIDPRTAKWIGAHHRLISRAAGERIRQELMILLSSPDCNQWMRQMDEAGLLTAIFKELEASRKCAQVYYGKGGVLKHTLDAMERMDYLLGDLDKILPALAKNIRQHFKNETCWEGLLRLGILLHDIAKPATARRIKGRLRFFEHDTVGATMATQRLEALRFSRHEIEKIAAYILHHLRPGNLAHNETISDKAVFRFFRDIGAHGVGLALVAWTDHASYLTPAKLKSVLPHVCKDPHTFPASKFRNPDTRKTLHHLQTVHYLLHSYFRRPERILPPKLLNGNEVMKILGIPPGPKIGKILLKLQEAQAEGKVLDRDSAARFIKKSNA